MTTLLLGAGRIGQAIAWDLARDPGGRVVVADRSPEALARATERAEVETVEADLSDPVAVRRLAEGADLVVGALPSGFGFAALEAVIEAGRPYADISFFEQDPFALDPRARRRGVCAVVDCGLAPGLSNLLAAEIAARFDSAERLVIRVGGLPVERRPPWEYKAPFAPLDVLELYTRPVRLREAGREVVREAVSGVERVDIEGVGTLEAFNTNGLRTLLATLEVPDMVERTLRYPGHAEKILLLRDSGFLSEEPIDAGGARLVPRALTAHLLHDAWHLGEDEDDIAVLSVEVTGRRGGRREREVAELVDRRDPATGFSAMARTTGFTCTAIARQLADGSFARPGVAAPEHLAAAGGRLERLLGDLEARGLHVHRRLAPVE